jgi:cohesin loading factor subunit SCC2
METNHYAIQYGVASGSNGNPIMNGGMRTRSRVLTVDEALPYSPFSSVVPFNSGTDNLVAQSHLNLLTISS